MTWRLRLLYFGFLLWAGFLLTRLGYWQLYLGKSLRASAESQYTQSRTLQGVRGQILASDGYPLATSSDSFLFFVNPQKLPDDLDPIISVLDTLDASESAKAQLTSPDKSDRLWWPILPHISPPVKDRLEQLQLAGLGFEPNFVRRYPEGSSSAYLTGFLGRASDGTPTGYFGLEGFYERQLSGTPGKLTQETDGLGQPIVIGSELKISARIGRSIPTSIDRVVQYTAFKKLTAGLERYQALSGTVTVIESQTGRVLAMVSLPAYDPNTFSSSDSKLYRNPIVADGYEPGSTFKAIIMASALDAGVVTPDTVCTICQGPAIVSDKTIRSYNNKYYPDSTMPDVILHSDNVGMVFVGKLLGKDKLLAYLKKFGFGQPTGVDLQEDSTPTLRPDNQWGEVELATASFGQGIAVTPLQLTSAVNVLATRGLYYPPQVGAEPLPQPIRVISQTAATTTTEMLTRGVSTGEVRYYRPEGYQIAGKTGTAQIPIEGFYDPDKVIASFVGFAPADNPKFTMLVTLTEPKTSPWGSTTAAPLWFDIARELFRYYQIPPRPGL